MIKFTTIKNVHRISLSLRAQFSIKSSKGEGGSLRKNLILITNDDWGEGGGMENEKVDDY